MAKRASAYALIQRANSAMSAHRCGDARKLVKRLSKHPKMKEAGNKKDLKLMKVKLQDWCPKQRR